MKTQRLTLVLAIFLLAAIPIFAGSPEPVIESSPAFTTAEESPWSFRLALYGWMQSIDGR